MRTRRTWITRAVLVVMLLLALTTSVFASNPTDEPGSKMIECPDCGTSTACMVCYGLDPTVRVLRRDQCVCHLRRRPAMSSPPAASTTPPSPCCPRSSPSPWP